MLSWWFLLPCLLVSGLAAYLIVESTKAGDYPWAHYPLTVALAPILLVGVYAGAIVLSGAVFDFLETPQPASQLSVDGPGDQREHTTRVHARGYTASQDHPQDHARRRGGPHLLKRLTKRLANGTLRRLRHQQRRAPLQLPLRVLPPVLLPHPLHPSSCDKA